MMFPRSTDAQSAYYQNALGLNGNALKTSLHDIITNHNFQQWPLWSYFSSTDIKTGTTVWDMYSDIPGGVAPYTFHQVNSQCGTYNNEGDCYNHEHVWPKTFFAGDVYPMRSDLHHVYPTDGFVNNKRSNFPFGKVNTANWTSDNGSKLGVSTSYNTWTSSNSNHYCFEPIDSFKGDIARIMFYMATRYFGEDAGWSDWEMANGANLTSSAITILLDWHHKDPVSQKEMNRNQAVFLIQGNRNPFIDYPQFADCIWGTADCKPLFNEEVAETSFQFYPNPASDYLIIPPALKSESHFEISSVDGQNIKLPVVDNRINIQNLPRGLFFVRYIFQQKNYYSTFLKQ